ncbi:hypothetical protein [Sporomusa malonica]|uniref:Uncharacterized protein n=1 Tax=Sporomusa malonica TaxID=112901 RepID=A0A1W2BHZ6_9FIRM|nr:hypothetical protein [Sporomusa malonica]SMC72302.1 hypothetical protein SAMN04488500_107183 [Sporomusa malonica]
MGNIYDKNQESAHGPFGESQTHQGPYGGKNSDTMTNKKAANVIPPTKDIKARPKH